VAEKIKKEKSRLDGQRSRPPFPKRSLPSATITCVVLVARFMSFIVAAPPVSPPPPDVPEWAVGWLTVAPLLALPIATVAALVAFTSLCVAVSSRRLAGKAHDLNVAKNDRQAPRLDINVVEARARASADHDQTIDVRLVVTNQSEVATSIRSARLWLRYTGGSEEVSPAGVQPLSPAFLVPRSLNVRDTAEGWLRFELAGPRIADLQVDSYDLVIRDADDRPTEFSRVALRWGQ
jgi:hypothetical protein